jgi:hypothetical protein
MSTPNSKSDKGVFSKVWGGTYRSEIGAAAKCAAYTLALGLTVAWPYIGSIRVIGKPGQLQLTGSMHAYMNDEALDELESEHLTALKFGSGHFTFDCDVIFIDRSCGQYTAADCPDRCNVLDNKCTHPPNQSQDLPDDSDMVPACNAAKVSSAAIAVVSILSLSPLAWLVRSSRVWHVVMTTLFFGLVTSWMSSIAYIRNYSNAPDVKYTDGGAGMAAVAGLFALSLCSVGHTWSVYVLPKDPVGFVSPYGSASRVVDNSYMF